MWADAIRAEAFRLSKSRTTWFWSVFFAPILMVIMGAISSFVIDANATKLAADPEAPPELTQMLSLQPLDMGQAMIANAGNLSNALVLLFILIGAATVYAGDYRWETWRLISARNTRPNLLLGKLAVVTGLSLVAMLAMLISGTISDLIQAAVFDRGLTFTMDAGDVAQFFLLAGLSLLRILQFTMIGLLAAVMTRSLLVALFVPLVLAIAQFFLPMQVLPPMGFMPDSWLSILVDPGGALDAIKNLVRGGDAAAGVPDGVLLKAWISVALWTLLPAAGAIAWFNRQDLSKE